MFYKDNRTFQVDISGREIPPEGLELFPIAVNDMDLEKNLMLPSRVPHHWHKDIEVFILLKGQVQFEAGDQVFLMNPGDGCFVNSGVLHGVVGIEDCRFYYNSMVFDAGIVGGTPGSIFDVKYVRPVLENGSDFLMFHDCEADRPWYNAFYQAFDACRDGGDGYELAAREGIGRLLLEVGRRVEPCISRHLSSQREQRIKDILTWVNAHLEDSVTVSDMATVVHVSERECQRLFQQYLHCRPLEYLNRHRIIAAAERLVNTDDEITEIAMTYGFGTPSYFTKQFRLMMNTSPREYRKAFQNLKLSDTPALQ